jgi:hypothetical protein
MKSLLCLPLAALAALFGASTTATAADDDSALERMLSGESALQGAELERALAEADHHPLGSMQNPVRASMPPGERAYLDRLRCPDGRAPRYERQGSGGDSPYGNIIDYYAVQCAGAEPVSVIMDMYHRGHVETRPVPGFTIVAP